MHLLFGADALRPPLTGIGQYAEQLFKGLCESPETVDIQCLYGESIIDAQKLFPVLNKSAKYTESKFFQYSRSMLRTVPGMYALRSKIRNLSTKRVMQRCVAGNAIYHEPNYILRPYSGCSITTIHDLSFLHYPQYHPKERVKFMERELPGTLAQAAHIITDAEYVKSELVKYFNIPPETITAIPLGVSPDFRPMIERETAGVLDKYALGYDGYLLSVATQEPRKNLEGLLQAYLSLPETMQRHFPLVLVGGHGWNCERIEKHLKCLELKGTVRRLGFVPANELPCLYAGANAFAYPSFYEGFGLPPLEAMASATPVLVADNSAMAEVVGEAGIQVDANDSAAIASGLKRLLSDSAYRSHASKAGLQRAASYTWDKCVNRTMAVYRHAQEL